jgi:hypothetical protein
MYYHQLPHYQPMAHFKKITSALSVASTVLLQACSSTGSESATAPAPVANTLAPQLVATWQTDCIITQNSSSSTTTQASGGSGGVSGGAAYRNTAVFTQDGRVEFSTENFATSNCNANTLSGYGRYDAVYFIGTAGLANDGSPVTEFSYSDSTTTTYSIFQVVNSTALYLGDGAASTPGNDGASITTRLDGLGPPFSKI